MSAPRILLVDDDPALLQALPETIHLRFSDAVVDTALSVQDARVLLRQHDYDVVITDLVMPEESGLRLMEEMLQLRLTSAVMLITAHLNPEGYSHLGDAFTFVRKPIDREFFARSLRNAIRFGLARRRLARSERRTEMLEQQGQQLEELRAAIEDMNEKLTAAKLETRFRHD
jgi:DNA-binding NtrC family response regulator